MLTIKVYSREEILGLKDSIPKGSKVISIVSSESERIDFGDLETYGMVFLDVTDRRIPGAFSESDAKKLSLWIRDRVYDPSSHNFELWIHCDAGISRSYAVAEVIYEFAVQGLTRPDDFNFPLYRNPGKHANPLVRRQLFRELENLIFDYLK